MQRLSLKVGTPARSLVLKPFFDVKVVEVLWVASCPLPGLGYQCAEATGAAPKLIRND